MAKMQKFRNWVSEKPDKSYLLWSLIAIPIAVGLVTFLGISLRRPNGSLSHIFLYLLIVVLAAVWSGLGMALYAFSLSVLAVYYFFVPPRGSFKFNFDDYSYTSEILGLAVFCILSFFVTYLVWALRKERDRARALMLREREAKEEVLATSRELEKQQRRSNYLQRARQLLGDTIEPETVLQKVLHELVNALGGAVVLVLENQDGKPELSNRFWQAGNFTDKEQKSNLIEEQQLVLAMRAGGQLFGRLGYTFDDNLEKLGPEERQKEENMIVSALSALAEYIAISLENAKLYQTLEFQNIEIAQMLRSSLNTDTVLGKRVDQLSVFYRISAAVISGVNRYNLMTLCLSEAARVLNCGIGVVLLFNDKNDHLELAAQRGYLSLSLSKIAKYSVDKGLIGYVLKSGKPFVSNYFDRPIDEEEYPVLAASLSPIHSCLYLPIKSGSEVFGLVIVGAAEKDQYSQEDVDFMVGLVSLLAMALVSSEYYRERERAASIEERNRLARDLHDGLAQSINYIGLKTQLVAELYEAGETEQVKEEIERIARAAELARMDVREVLYGLRHTERDRNLLLSLADLIRSLSDLSGIKISLTTSDPANWPSLSLSTNIQLLRIAQEALSNIQKHSKASEAQVEALYLPETNCVRLRVCDNGIGFEPDLTRSNGSYHLGLSIMRERATRLPARLEVKSQPDSGTEITVEYEYRQNEANLKELNNASVK
ncbi:MAG TPA: GAF domain-containing protein [Chloroflexia bacterium]|nr:GAF domain-containing protein [Chloroflexia bacterium]